MHEDDGPRPARRRRALLGVLLAALLLVAAAIVVLVADRDEHPRPPFPHQAREDVRAMAIVLSERSIKRGWPPWGGKNFVLALIAYDLVDARNPDNLKVLFPDRTPGFHVPPRDAYRQVTPETLGERRFPLLTHVAGRRNDDPRYTLAPDANRTREPIVACVVSGIWVVVGTSDGWVTVHTRESLGLEDGAPILFGDRATVPMLRVLSDE